MLTPDTRGGIFQTELMLHQHSQTEGKINVLGPRPYVMESAATSGMGYYGAFSMMDSLDLYWHHSASAPSMLGFKWQFLGNSLQAQGSGHSMAIAAAAGANEHELDGTPTIAFKVGAVDATLLHGYWLTPNWQIYESLGYSRHSFDGDVKKIFLAGPFSDVAVFYMASVGSQLVIKPFRLQLEVTYTQATWRGEGKVNYLGWGLGLGYLF
jgi:hypothetical protein